MGLHKVVFENLRSGMVVSREQIRLYEVLMADKTQVMMMMDDKRACLITKEEFEKSEWFTVTPRQKGNRRGKAKD